MRRKLLENEVIVKKWGQLNLSSHRLWIESGDDDNYFLNSVELHKIQGHSIVKYNNQFLLTLAVSCFFLSPLSVLVLKFTSKEFALDLNPHIINWFLLGTGLAFVLAGANFLWRFQNSRSLTLNFQAGPRNIYFKLTGEFARIEDALNFSNLVDSQIIQLKIKPDEPAPPFESDKTISFKIS